MKKTIWLMLVLLALPLVLGDSADLDEPLSPEDKAMFDEMLNPVMKIYNFIKYIASVVAGIFLLYGGITYMTSSNDPRKRDSAKNIIAYVVIGLIIIWIAPYIVKVLV